GLAGRAAAGAGAQGVRGARDADAGREHDGQRRGTAGEGMGRERRPVYERGPGGDHDAAAQAGPAAGDPDDAWIQIPPWLVSPVRTIRRSRVTVALASLFAGYLALPKAMFARVLRRSLRRNIALALTAVAILGYFVISAVLNLVVRVWSATVGHSGCFTPNLF